MILSRTDRERLRKQFLPAVVKLMFVGEAPPASGRFFYRQDSGLFRAIKEVFVEYDPSINEMDFLAQFERLGCYLVDLCGKPVDRFEERERRRARTIGERHLAAALRELQPAILISVVRAIEPNVAAAIRLANWSGRHVALPYPGRWHRYRKVFQSELLTLLRSLSASASADDPRQRER
jgi:hypothetical protein